MRKYILFIVAMVFILGCGSGVLTSKEKTAGSLFGVEKIITGKGYIIVYLADTGPQIVSKTNQPGKNLVSSGLIRVERGEELIISDGEHVTTCLFLKSIKGRVALINVEDCERLPMEEEKIKKYKLSVDSFFSRKEWITKGEN